MERLSTIASKTFADDLRKETAEQNQPISKKDSKTSTDLVIRKGTAKALKKDGLRDYAAERDAAWWNTSSRVADLAVARRDQTLGDEYIKLAQAMILCTLPHSPTKDTK